MTGNTEQTARVLDDLIELERRIETTAKAVSTSSSSGMPLDAASLLADLRASSQRHREDLERQRHRIAEGALSVELPAIRSFSKLYATLSEAVFAYSVLHARAHRDFDSQVEGNTADLAESHLRAYANAVQHLNLLGSDIAVSELGDATVDCRCQCPACGLGLCLCSAHGSNTVRQTMQEGIPKAPEGGLRVRRPRAGSEAERAGLVAGDRVVAIDEKEIASDLDVTTVQAAIRARASGETLQLQVARGPGAPLELTVRRP